MLQHPEFRNVLVSIIVNPNIKNTSDLNDFMLYNDFLSFHVLITSCDNKHIDIRFQKREKGHKKLVMPLQRFFYIENR